MVPGLRLRVFLCVFGSARAPVCTWGLMFTQTDGGAHLFILRLSEGEPQNEPARTLAGPENANGRADVRELPAFPSCC